MFCVQCHRQIHEETLMGSFFHWCEECWDSANCTQDDYVIELKHKGRKGVEDGYTV